MIRNFLDYYDFRNFGTFDTFACEDSPDFDANLPMMDYRQKEQISDDNQVNSRQYLDEPEIIGMSTYLMHFDNKKLRFSINYSPVKYCAYVQPNIIHSPATQLLHPSSFYDHTSEHILLSCHPRIHTSPLILLWCLTWPLDTTNTNTMPPRKARMDQGASHGAISLEMSLLESGGAMDKAVQKQKLDDGVRDAPMASIRKKGICHSGIYSHKCHYDSYDSYD
jgi:hypothetical protein